MGILYIYLFPPIISKHDVLAFSFQMIFRGHFSLERATVGNFESFVGLPEAPLVAVPLPSNSTLLTHTPYGQPQFWC